MGCNCSLTEKIIGALVIVFAWWNVGYNDIILTVLGVGLILHALTCKNCKVPMAMSKPVVKKATKKKRK